VLTKPAIVVGADAAETLKQTTQWLTETTHASLRRSGRVSWALSGGSTPIPLYRDLAAESDSIPWGDLTLYVVDERDVYPADPLSNYGMLQTTLLDPLARPPAKVVPWHTAEDPGRALAEYRAALAPLPRYEGFPEIDLVLLGMGGDGHTASVFPGSPQQDNSEWVAYGSGPNANRYTLTLPLICSARHVGILVTGADKASRVRECLTDPTCALPAAWVSRQGRSVHWFLDAKSASEL
jgi:6-phosphogluconolactonase